MISQYYKNNSTQRHYHTNDLDFDFKTFNTPFNEMTDVSDLSFGISTNEHPFYNDFTLGKPDAKTMFGNDGIATNVRNDAADFVSTEITPTYCIIYYPNDQSAGYPRNMIANFKYMNFTTGETNITDTCYLVTDFQFDNIILQMGTVQKNYWENIYVSDQLINAIEYGDNMETLNDVYIAYLHYWTGGNSISIDGYFELYSVIQLNGETIAYKLTNNNILSTLVTPPVQQGVETDDFTGSGYVGAYERFPGKMIGGKPFNHVCNANNYVFDGQYFNLPQNDEELGNLMIPQYINPFIIYYANMCRKDYFYNIVAATGLRFMYTFYKYGVSPTTYNSEISIAYMDNRGVVDYKNIIKGINNINNSDAANKNISYDTLPSIYNRPNKAKKTTHKVIVQKTKSQTIMITKHKQQFISMIDEVII